MNRHATILSLCAAAFCFNSGCLFVRQTTSVVREKENLRPVQFESEQARQYFEGGVHELQSHKQNFDQQVSAVPFLWLYSSNKELSDNAIYNDQISACDTNGDGVISMQEALEYRAKVAEQFRPAEKAKKDEHDSSASKPAFTMQPSDKPPALIDLSSPKGG